MKTFSMHITKIHILFFLTLIVILSFSFTTREHAHRLYESIYYKKLSDFEQQQHHLLNYIQQHDLASPQELKNIQEQILLARNNLKSMDFWLRYLEPIAYKKINGPLPVEWETEVFEKFEKPYKREGAGLTLALLYLDEEHPQKEELFRLLNEALVATQTYKADSITTDLTTYHHFFLCNRLYLLNLAAIYSTGFECPDTASIIPELRSMIKSVTTTYDAFNESFSSTPLSGEYLSLYQKTIAFVKAQPDAYSSFNHFTFIRDYINPLFALNQQLIRQYQVETKSYVDYSLNNNATSIFQKNIYRGQNAKGVFLRVHDEKILTEISHVGKLLFYDPILSGNNERSCASCHNPSTCFTDTILATSFQFNHKDMLPRNSPSLVNAEYNHLLMLDGKHFSLQHQTKGVMTNTIEMGSTEKEIVAKVMSCKEYNCAFTKLLKLTPQETEVTLDHIASTITYYYSTFSKSYSPFDEAMNEHKAIDVSVQRGFNIFMSKAQCATCHFVPQFNGVKPPFIGSEFEVLGVPSDTTFSQLGNDKGRYEVNPADEMLYAFRTGSIRNIEHTKPYMHNGVFTTLKEVIDFYDAGGGAGRGLPVANQTLSSDSLRLSSQEKEDLIAFMHSLNEHLETSTPPVALPVSSAKLLNTRKVGGTY